MKKILKKVQILLLGISVCIMFSCKEDSVGSEASILHSFSVIGKDGTYFKGTVSENNSITIKVSPYLDAKQVLASAKPVFYLSKGATVAPDPLIAQDFSKEGGVDYTVTAQDGVTKTVYKVGWGISDQLPDGSGFSYAEIGTNKSFVQLGYPGEVSNFGLSDSKLYGDLDMIPAYCADHIVLLSRAYATANPSSPLVIKVFDKTTLAESGTLNMGSISAANLRLITSDYKGNCIGMVVRGSQTEFFVWSKVSDTPKSIGQINVNMASTTDGSANFQVVGDVTGDAWITAMAPRGVSGEHYRIKVSNGQLASSFSTLKTGHSSSDCSGFQMIAPLSAADETNYIVGDTEGAAATANSIKVYQKTFGGSTVGMMPGLWQNILQAWWVGTGMSTSRYGGKSPFVSALPINGKIYTFVTSGTGWWHSAAVLSADLQTLAHENLNIAASVNRGWSYGSSADWYYDEVKKEAYLAVWMGRLGLKTYKLTCFE